jgi:hypothetical protein
MDIRRARAVIRHITQHTERYRQALRYFLPHSNMLLLCSKKEIINTEDNYLETIAAHSLGNKKIMLHFSGAYSFSLNTTDVS